MEEEVDVTTVEEWIEGNQLNSQVSTSQDGPSQITDSQHPDSKLTDSQHMSSKLADTQSTKSKISLLQSTHTNLINPDSKLQDSKHISSKLTDTQTPDIQAVNSKLPVVHSDPNITESQSTNSQLADLSELADLQNVPRIKPDIMDSIQSTCELLLQANLEYLILVGMKRDTIIQGTHFQSPRGRSFLDTQSVDLLKEFLSHCYGEREVREATNVDSAGSSDLIQNEEGRDTEGTEGQQVKVIDEVFTEVQNKLTKVKNESLDDKVEEEISYPHSKLKRKKRQENDINETEVSTEMLKVDEDSDDFCDDFYMEEYYDDDNDEDWQCKQDKKVKEPKAKKIKLTDLDSKRKTTTKGSKRNALSATSGDLTEDKTTNQSARYNTRRKTTSNRKTTTLGKRSRIANEQSATKTRDKVKGSKEEGERSGQMMYKCAGCQKEFSSELERRLHHKSNGGCSSRKKFFCDVCSLGFLKKSSLLNHQKKDHKAEKDKIHICIRCKEEFRTKHELQDHMTKHEKRACLICKEVFSEEEAFEEHKLKHKHEKEVGGDEDIKMSCVNCEQVFFIGMEQTDSCSMLCEECCNNHYSCLHCQQKYKLFYLLAMHDCKKSFIKNMEEINALDFQKFKGKLPCHICQKEFDGRKNLCSHYKLHSSDTRYQCDICWQYYKDSSKLNKHKRVVHNEKRRYECTHCGLKYKEKDTLNRHKKVCDLTRTKISGAESREENQSEKVENKSSEFHCEKCLKTFATERIFTRHRCSGQDGSGEEVEEEREIKEEDREDEEVEQEEDGDDVDNAQTGSSESFCKNCGKFIKNGKKQPLCKQCAKNKFTCSNCHQAFNMFYLLALHDCNKTFKENLQDIKKKKGTNVPLTCNLCNKPFKNRKSLCSHYRCHYYEGPIQCEICQQTFKHQNSLNKHRRYVHTASRDYMCDICGKAFKQSDTLNTHRRLHTHEKTKEFQCHVCKKFLSGSTALAVHMNIHSGALPYICEICGRAFRQYGNMQKHMIVHGTSKLYYCPICPDKSFKHSETYKIHMKTHVLSNELPENKYGKIYSCPHCEKKMPSASQYTVHLRTHTNERPFPCKVCSKAFKENGKLKRHMKTHLQDQGSKQKKEARTGANHQSKEKEYQSEETEYQSRETAGYQSSSEPNSLLETITVYPTDVNGPITQTIAIPVTDNRISFVSSDLAHFSVHGAVISVENSEKYYRERILPLE